MKKNTFLFSLIVLIVLGFTVENLFPNMLSFSKSLNSKKSDGLDYSKKYVDCINDADFLARSNPKLEGYTDEHQVIFEELNLSLEKYQRSLDSTIQNLNTIDAHEFLHSEYEKSKDLIQKENTSEIKQYYHIKAMELCYTMDKSLNVNLKGNPEKF